MKNIISHILACIVVIVITSAIFTSIILQYQKNVDQAFIVMMDHREGLCKEILDSEEEFLGIDRDLSRFTLENPLLTDCRKLQKKRPDLFDLLDE